MMKTISHQQVTLEITVISAQGLKNTNSSLLSNRLRPFITLTTNSEKHNPLHKTRVDDKGGINPTWGDKFHLQIDTNFFYQNHSCIYLQLYTKNLMLGQTQLGWCRIPVTDIADGLLPARSVRYLSYRVRDRDGSRGHGVVNIAVKLEGSLPMEWPMRKKISGIEHLTEMGTCQTVIGIPVKMFPTAGDGGLSSHGS